MAHMEARFSRELTTGGRTYEKGAPVPPGLFNSRRFRQLEEQRKIEHVMMDDGVDLEQLDELKAENAALRERLANIELVVPLEQDESSETAATVEQTVEVSPETDEDAETIEVELPAELG